jgi:uncharacterized protein (DUF427 family)
MNNRQKLIPGADHPITLSRPSKRVVVRLDGAIIADSKNTVALAEAGYPPVHYFPIDDVAAGALRKSDRVTYCPYKGEASYYHLAGQGREDSVWSYEAPYDAVEAIAGHVAFYPDRVDSIEVLPIETAAAVQPSG